MAHRRPRVAAFAKKFKHQKFDDSEDDWSEGKIDDPGLGTSASHHQNDAIHDNTIPGTSASPRSEDETNDNTIPGTSASPRSEDKTSESEDDETKEKIDDVDPATSSSHQQNDKFRESEDDSSEEKIDDPGLGTSASHHQNDAIRVLQETIVNIQKQLANLSKQIEKLVLDKEIKLKQTEKRNQQLEEKIRKMQQHVVTPTKDPKQHTYFGIVKLYDAFPYYIAICRQERLYGRRLDQIRTDFPKCKEIFKKYCPNPTNLFNRFKEFCKYNMKVKIRKGMKKEIIEEMKKVLEEEMKVDVQVQVKQEVKGEMKEEMKEEMEEYHIAFDNKYLKLCEGYKESDLIADVRKLLTEPQL